MTTELIISICTFLGALISFIITFVQLKKEKKIGAVQTIVSFLPALINSAETNIQKNVGDDSVKLGFVRLTYVLSKIRELCVAYNVNYDEDFYKDKVEEILSTPQKNIKEVLNNEIQSKTWIRS